MEPALPSKYGFRTSFAVSNDISKAEEVSISLPETLSMIIINILLPSLPESGFWILSATPFLRRFQAVSKRIFIVSSVPGLIIIWVVFAVFNARILPTSSITATKTVRIPQASMTRKELLSIPLKAELSTKFCFSSPPERIHNESSFFKWSS